MSRREETGDVMIVCHCKVVNDREVQQAVSAGARTVAQVCRATRAGTDCGSCVFSVKRLLCGHEAPSSLELATA
jgi:bacterioferritin-associated ferredoxin